MTFLYNGSRNILVAINCKLTFSMESRILQLLAEIPRRHPQSPAPMPTLENPRHEAFAQAAEASENPILVNAARLAVLDASRLQAALADRRYYERRDLDKVFNDMAAEVKAMQRPSPPREAPAAAPAAPLQRPARSPKPPRQRRDLSPEAPRPLHRLSSPLE